MIFQRGTRCTLSNAFSKSMKQMYKLEFHSTVCSIIFLIINICSVVPRPSLNPAYSSLKCLFTSSAILLMIISSRSLDVVVISLVPLQFPQQVRFHFFGNIAIRPFFQSVGIVSSSHILSEVCEFVLQMFQARL